MIRASWVASALVVILPLSAVRADDEQPAGVQQSQKPSEPKDKAGKTEETKKTPAPAPTPAQLKEALESALKMAKSIDDQPAKKNGEFEIPDFASLTTRLSKDLQADTVKAIGRAQAKLKDLSAARASWQSALDISQEISSLDALKDRAQLSVDVAAAQIEAGEQGEAKITLRQALQAVRSMKSGGNSRFSLPVEMLGLDGDPVSQKVKLLAKIARLQSEVDDKTAAEDTVGLAIQTANSVEKPSRKVHALIEIAKGGPALHTKAIWQSAFEVATAINDDYARAKAVESVLRAQVEVLPIENSVSLASDRLKGDLQHYAIWVVADAIASSDKTFAPPVLSSLGQLALKAEFDRPTKKIIVFRRIAEGQARLGDFDGAYRTAGEPHPINDVQNFRATQARLHVMTAVAEAQLKLKQRNAALDTTQAALEQLVPLAGEDAEAYFPLAQFGSLQARCGDMAGALQTAEALSSVSARIQIICEVAKAHATAGRRDDARKVMLRTLDEAKRAPAEALWATARMDGGQMRALAGEIDPSLPVLQTIAETHAEIGDVDAALKVIANIDKSQTAQWVRNATIENIAEAQVKADDPAGALKTAELLTETGRFSLGGNKSKLLESIAKHQSKAGQAASVLEWAGKQTVPDAKLHALRGLAEGIAERVAPKEAKPKDSDS